MLIDFKFIYAMYLDITTRDSCELVNCLSLSYAQIS